MSNGYCHYIGIRELDGSIISGWSDGPYPDMDISDAICINKEGDYQFRLYPDGMENPPLYDMDFIPLYKWDGSKIVPRTKSEIESDRADILPSPPSEIELLRADIDFLAIMSGVNL